VEYLIEWNVRSVEAWRVVAGKERVETKALRLARVWRQCEWVWVRHENGVWQESGFRLGV